MRRTFQKKLFHVSILANKVYICNNISSRLLDVRSVIMVIEDVVTFERSEIYINDNLKIPVSLSSLFSSNSFWSNFKIGSSLINPLCQFLGFLECYSSTMADAYGCFLFIQHFYKTSKLLNK